MIDDYSVKVPTSEFGMPHSRRSACPDVIQSLESDARRSIVSPLVTGRSVSQLSPPRHYSSMGAELAFRMDCALLAQPLRPPMFPQARCGLNALLGINDTITPYDYLGEKQEMAAVNMDSHIYMEKMNNF